MKLIKRILHWKFLFGLLTVISVSFLLISYLSPFISPSTLKLMPLFGLGYVIILIGNILLLIFWIILKSRWKWVVSIALLVGGSLHFRTISISTDNENTESTELHIMSYNVRLFDRYSSDRKRNYEKKDGIFKFLNNKQPDVVCFQEFYQQDAPTNFITKDSIIEILGSIAYHERYSAFRGKRQKFGVAIFSKYPIIEKGTINFERQENSHNYCIYSDIVKEQDTFRVYNLHLESIHFRKDDYDVFSEEDIISKDKQAKALGMIRKVTKAFPKRAKQAQQVNRHIKSSPYPVIVCGDFNDTPMSYTYNQFNSQLTDAFRNTSFGIGATYAGNIPIGRIDYIFHSPTLNSKNFYVQKEKLSDHYAIDCKVFKRN